jgi:hypothetical protein
VGAAAASTAEGRGRAPCRPGRGRPSPRIPPGPVRWIAADDEHAPCGIHPALGVVVNVLASHGPILPPAADTRPELSSRERLEYSAEGLRIRAVVGGSRGWLAAAQPITQRTASSLRQAGPRHPMSVRARAPASAVTRSSRSPCSVDPSAHRRRTPSTRRARSGPGRTPERRGRRMFFG